MLFKILIQFSNIVYLLYEEEDIFLPKNCVLYTRNRGGRKSFIARFKGFLLIKMK